MIDRCFRCFLGMTIVGLTAAAADAQTPIPIDIPWSGNRPDHVEIHGPSGALPVDFVPAENRFRGAYPRSRSIAFDAVTIVARRGNMDERVTYLRFSPDLKTITIPILIPTYTECKQALIDPLLRPLNDGEAALEAYYRARALFLLNNASRCVGDRRRDAARAWLERSMELAMLNCMFRLNPEAANAYSEYDRNYVAEALKRAGAKDILCRSEARRRLWTTGEHALAFGVGQELETLLAKSTEASELAVATRAIAPAELVEQQKQLGTYLAATAAWQRDRSMQQAQPASAPPPR